MAYKRRKVETIKFRLRINRTIKWGGKILGVGWNDQSDKFLFDIKKTVDMSF